MDLRGLPPGRFTTVPQVRSSPIFGLHNRATSLATNAVFVFIFQLCITAGGHLYTVVSRWFNGFLGGGFAPNISTCLVMPARLANKRKKAY